MLIIETQNLVPHPTTSPNPFSMALETNKKLDRGDGLLLMSSPHHHSVSVCDQELGKVVASPWVIPVSYVTPLLDTVCEH
jgi:hypothetical protein